MFIDSYTHRMRNYRIYSLPEISSIETASEWLIEKSLIDGIGIRYFEINDGKSFHDGTVSTPASDPVQFRELVEAHKNDELLSMCLFGKYMDVRFGLIVDLETYHIQLSYGGEKILDYKKMEELLGLAEL